MGHEELIVDKVGQRIRHKYDDTRTDRVSLGMWVDCGNGGDGRSRIGRVYEIHFNCPQDEDWLAIQKRPYSEEEVKGERWIGVLLHQSGSIITSENRLSKLNCTQELDHSYAKYYFGNN
jgi:hypothetical protein